MSISRRLFSSLAASGCCTMLATSLHAQVFVADVANGIIGEYSLTGAIINPTLIDNLNDQDGNSDAAGLAVSGNDLFVPNADTGSISEYTTAGAAVNLNLIPGVTGPSYIAISGSDIYVLNGPGGTVGEYSGTGATINANLVTGLGYSSGIAITDGSLFVLSGNYGVSKYNATSGALETSGLFNQDADGIATGVVASGSNLFLSHYSGGNASEYTTSGLAVEPNLVTGLPAVQGIAISGSDIFLTTNGDGSTVGSAVVEYTTKGVYVGTIASGLGYLEGVAVSPVPEPDSVTLLLGGLALIGAIVYRRRRGIAISHALDTRPALRLRVP